MPRRFVDRGGTFDERSHARRATVSGVQVKRRAWASFSSLGHRRSLVKAVRALRTRAQVQPTKKYLSRLKSMEQARQPAVRGHDENKRGTGRPARAAPVTSMKKLSHRPKAMGAVVLVETSHALFVKLDIVSSGGSPNSSSGALDTESQNASIGKCARTPPVHSEQVKPRWQGNGSTAILLEQMLSVEYSGILLHRRGNGFSVSNKVEGVNQRITIPILRKEPPSRRRCAVTA